jgi:cbb3-type cytochrome oxidase subunit 1
MPYVSRLFIKTGITYLVVTFIAGAVLLSLDALGHPAPFIVGVEHGHAGFVGWLVNTVIGVAYWLLPANRARFPQTQGRYPERLARSSFYLLNIGLLLRLFGEPFVGSGAAVRAAVVVGAVLQVLGIAAFAWIAWQRIFAPPLRPGA